MAKKLYLFRHGETDWNKEGRIQCCIDIELNENGLKQAKINAKNLKDKGIEHVYASPLKRAYKTGEILADEIGAGIEIVEDLKELIGGDCEGLTRQQIIERIGEENYELFAHSRQENMDFGYPNGETKREVRNRITKAIENICKTTPYNTIAIASHGFVLREFIRNTDFEDDSTPKNCEIVEAEYENDGKIKIIRRVKYEN